MTLSHEFARGAIEAGRRVVEIEANALKAVAARIDERFERAVVLVASCSGRVVVTGIGKSGLVGKKIAATLASTGTPAFFLHPAEGVHGDLGMLMRGDVVLALSNSGETHELLALIPAVKRLALPLVAITSNSASQLAEHADVALDIGVREEACPMNLTPTASTTATMALGDALAVAVLARRGFRPEDFALLHPGGSLGRQLLRVGEIMRRGVAIPTVAEEATVDRAIQEMTDKGLGATLVLDQSGIVTGIITDGDIRRLLQRTPLQLPRTAGEMMTCRPKTIAVTDWAVSALELMERYAITQLAIIDAGGKPEGILHLHDLLRAKIA